MTTPKPTLREILLDSLEDAYWQRRAEIEGCRDCTRNPAGVCADHQADNDAAHEYDEARKTLQRTPAELDRLVPAETGNEVAA